MKTTDFLKFKNQRKISMVTCYDNYTAKILAQTDVDAILVGDSLAMVVYGYPNTLAATVDMMAAHTEAVVRGAPNKLIISDLPFLSYHKGRKFTFDSIDKLMKAGANMIKLEGMSFDMVDLIRDIISAGVPVIGHLGLTPQSINNFGGFVVQGRTDDAKESLLNAIISLEAAGASAVVLECIPSDIASKITTTSSLSTIGIGAGPNCDGQVLVLQDLLGITEKKFTFARHFLNGFELLKERVNEYDKAVKDGSFPSENESFK